MRVPPRFEREVEQFSLLSRDSVRSLLSAASLSRETDPTQFALWGTVLIALPWTRTGRSDLRSRP